MSLERQFANYMDHNQLQLPHEFGMNKNDQV